MRLSVQTGGIIDRFGIDEAFRMISEAGFDGIDLNLFFDHSDAELDDVCLPLLRAAEKYSLAFVQAHAPFSYTLFHETDNERVQHAALKSVEICGCLGCKYLIVHPGLVRENPKASLKDEWDYNIGMYSALIPVLKKQHIYCCLENLFVDGPKGSIMSGPCCDPLEAAEYVDVLNGIAGEEIFCFCLDTGHAMVLGRSYKEYFDTLGARIKVLHVHDNNGKEDRHLFPYMGSVDWENFCAGLRDIGYDGDLSFETFGTLKGVDCALVPDYLKLLGATGRMFVDRIADL